jgi:HlyD family secretion protein
MIRSRSIYLIRSPIDGTVVARNVDVGQTVAASLQAPTIFTIAQDLTKMWVYAKTDESDVDNIKVGKAVTFKVDALPKQTFQGVVSQIRMNPTTVQSVVTYDTIIEFANPELKLFPGMTAYVTIPVATVQNALKLPNTALRYKPPMAAEEILALYKHYGIEGVEGQPAGDDSTAPGAGTLASAGVQNLPRAPKAETAVVWKLHPDHSMEPVKVSLGITDHAYTEVSALLKGELKEGDDVIIRSVTPKSQAPGGIRR